MTSVSMPLLIARRRPPLPAGAGGLHGAGPDRGGGGAVKGKRLLDLALLLAADAVLRAGGGSAGAAGAHPGRPAGVLHPAAAGPGAPGVPHPQAAHHDVRAGHAGPASHAAREPAAPPRAGRAAPALQRAHRGHEPGGASPAHSRGCGAADRGAPTPGGALRGAAGHHRAGAGVPGARGGAHGAAGCRVCSDAGAHSWISASSFAPPGSTLSASAGVHGRCRRTSCRDDRYPGRLHRPRDAAGTDCTQAAGAHPAGGGVAGVRTGAVQPGSAGACRWASCCACSSWRRRRCPTGCCSPRAST